MTSRQRKLLQELLDCTNYLGGSLDATATSIKKYIDRQQAHMLTYKIIYAILCDNKDNEYTDENYADAYHSLNLMKNLTTKEYKDKQGF